jgi:hypothetical protein
MTRKDQAASLLSALAGDAGARLVRENGGYRLHAGGRPGALVAAALVRKLLSAGLLSPAADRSFVASQAVAAWLRRRAGGDSPFQAQHGLIERRRLGGAGEETVRVNAAESPIAVLARRKDAKGRPWLAEHAVEAAERLRRDFEIGGLQPRVTANWSAAVNTGRRTDAAGLADLTDAALAARLRFARAMKAIGPELSGVLVDICCFLKGIEAVEREHSWPARSGKLVLRLALDALARHYGLAAAARGPEGRSAMRHWGAEDYRPALK